ncbi:hypothetical protein SAMN03097699_1754 [Flavobacteriaceae bacterium MAR_2010_188]|nr:hypothetical protein SAMN03097699_1754 [Flavobacteriaceae bacterium MAR_2010_188]
MIKFFRKIRKSLLTDNKFTKPASPAGRYLLYAVGEIILVVIGILIALQINNKNEERKQSKELDGLMKSISSAIQSDVKYLKLIKTARQTIGISADSIFEAYIQADNPTFSFEDYAYVANTFNELITPIYFQPNTSSFEALKNSLYLSKLQGTDIELLLQSYYASAERIKKQEEDYNQLLKTDYQLWSNKYRNDGSTFFRTIWNYKDSAEKKQRFVEILNDEDTKSLFEKGFEESNMVSFYSQQLILGDKFIEMVKDKEFNFNEQTKIDFSGTLNSYAEVDILNLLVNGKIPANFDMIYAHSGDVFYPGITSEDGYAVLVYPDNTFAWGSPFFAITALNGRVTEMDFSKYKNVALEMRGVNGGEQFALMMKDKYDLPDGTESRVNIKLTKNWETYAVPLDQFKTADKTIIKTPLGFVFLGNEGLTIHVRSIQFN